MVFDSKPLSVKFNMKQRSEAHSSLEINNMHGLQIKTGNSSSQLS